MVLSDGTTVWLGTSPDGGEDTHGLDLRGVSIGCEGMFGVVTRVLVKLSPKPECFETFLVVFENVEDASRTVSNIIKAGIVPGALEMMDQLITQAIEQAYHFGFPLDAGAVLIIELDGPRTGMEQEVAKVTEICQGNKAREIRRAQSSVERSALWKCRKRAFGAIGRISPNYLTQDGVVPRSKLPVIMRYIQNVSEQFQLRIPNVFHAGDGNIHPLILFDERDSDQVKRAIEAGEHILEKCLELGGSVSGEHGIGVEKIGFMKRQFTESDLQAMMDVRTAFDPKHKCNPHKMFPNAKRCSDFAIKKQAPA
jgi:glycolate oxidase